MYSAGPKYLEEEEVVIYNEEYFTKEIVVTKSPNKTQNYVNTICIFLIQKKKIFNWLTISLLIVDRLIIRETFFFSLKQYGWKYKSYWANYREININGPQTTTTKPSKTYSGKGPGVNCFFFFIK